MLSAPTLAKRREEGFTLVELLIVVIILGILAAVVIPQFNSAASESKEAALASNLATIRQAIEMYKVQHDDNFPGATIVVQLTTATDKTGATGTAYGPYLRNGFPKNPVSSGTTPDEVEIVATALTAVSGTKGWIYSTLDGQFKANEAGAGPSGTNYFDL